MKTTFNDRLACGKISAIAGKPGEGLGLLLALIAASVSSGISLPTTRADEDIPCGDVLLISPRDDFEKVHVPRLLSANADLSRIANIATDYFGDRTVPKDYQERIDAWVKDSPSPTLVIIDPIDTVWYSSISGLRAQAKKYNIYVIVTTALHKSELSTKDDWLKSNRWLKGADSVLLLDKASIRGVSGGGLWQIKGHQNEFVEPNINPVLGLTVVNGNIPISKIQIIEADQGQITHIRSRDLPKQKSIWPYQDPKTWKRNKLNSKRFKNP